MIDDLRNKISEIDKKIVRLLSERSEVVLDIAKAKQREKLPLYKPHREQEVFLSLNKYNRGPLKDLHLHNIYREIMSASLLIEGNLRAAYLGPEGSFTHQAALKKFGSSLELTAFQEVDPIFQAIEKGEFQYGILPIENSIEGKVTATLDALLEYGLYIYAEVHLPVNHQLISFSRSLQKITTLYTHRQARFQCRKWLSENLPMVEWIETSSTSKAVMQIADKKDKKDAAIGSRAAASFYGVPILFEKIEDSSQNFTRFIVVSKELSEPAEKDRTTFVFSLPDTPGSLYNALEIIFKAKLNMTSIESRPNRSELWNYIFYVDIEGHQSMEPLKSVIQRLKEKTTFLKVLGSYPIDVA